MRIKLDHTEKTMLALPLLANMNKRKGPSRTVKGQERARKSLNAKYPKRECSFL